jgi:hypothetical protein
VLCPPTDDQQQRRFSQQCLAQRIAPVLDFGIRPGVCRCQQHQHTPTGIKTRQVFNQITGGLRVGLIQCQLGRTARRVERTQHVIHGLRIGDQGCPGIIGHAFDYLAA